MSRKNLEGAWRTASKRLVGDPEGGEMRCEQAGGVGAVRECGGHEEECRTNWPRGRAGNRRLPLEEARQSRGSGSLLLA